MAHYTTVLTDVDVTIDNWNSTNPGLVEQHWHIPVAYGSFNDPDKIRANWVDTPGNGLAGWQSGYTIRILDTQSGDDTTFTFWNIAPGIDPDSEVAVGANAFDTFTNFMNKVNNHPYWGGKVYFDTIGGYFDPLIPELNNIPVPGQPGGNPVEEIIICELHVHSNHYQGAEGNTICVQVGNNPGTNWFPLTFTSSGQTVPSIYFEEIVGESEPIIKFKIDCVSPNYPAGIDISLICGVGPSYDITPVTDPTDQLELAQNLVTAIQNNTALNYYFNATINADNKVVLSFKNVVTVTNGTLASSFIQSSGTGLLERKSCLSGDFGYRGTQYTIVSNDNPNITVTRTSCHEYTIATTDATLTSVTIVVKDSAGVTSQTYTNYNVYATPLVMTIPKDGVYYFYITDNTRAFYYYYTKIDLCNLAVCYTNLLNDIMCSDPCGCDDCDEDPKSMLKKKKFLKYGNMLYFSLLANVYKANLTYTYPTYNIVADGTETAYYEKTQDMVNSLGKWLDCSLCNDLIHNSDSEDCGC